jgi:hypothetical protein
LLPSAAIYSHPDKILSLFEPHSVVIRKGKAHKPNEFGRLVRIEEVENGLVSNYAVAPGNQPLRSATVSSTSISCC